MEPIILHVFQIKKNNFAPINSILYQDVSDAEPEAGESPLCESLIDLQLTAEERDTVPAEQREIKKAHFYVWCNSPCNSLQVAS